MLPFSIPHIQRHFFIYVARRKDRRSGSVPAYTVEIPVADVLLAMEHFCRVVLMEHFPDPFELPQARRVIG
jgi:hypothetical protein